MKFSDRFISLTELLILLVGIILGIACWMLSNITYAVLLWVALVAGYILGKKT